MEQNKPVPFNFLEILFIKNEYDVDNLLYLIPTNKEFIICNLYDGCTIPQLQKDIEGSLLESGWINDDLKRITYIDIIDKNEDFIIQMHKLYMQYIRPLRKKNKYTHVLWYDNDCDICDIDFLIHVSNLLYKNRRPTLLYKFKSDNSEYPKVAMADSFGLNFLTSEMLSSNNYEEFNFLIS
jgi:hypothetical protein